jgi:hypothetical protein
MTRCPVALGGAAPAVIAIKKHKRSGDGRARPRPAYLERVATGVLPNHLTMCPRNGPREFDRVQRKDLDERALCIESGSALRMYARVQQPQERRDAENDSAGISSSPKFAF